jgi:hypothetical protein
LNTRVTTTAKQNTSLMGKYYGFFGRHSQGAGL